MSSADDVLEMSVVCGMRGVGAVCMCLGRDECMRRLGMGFTNPVGTEEVCDVCLCLDFGGVCGE